MPIEEKDIRELLQAYVENNISPRQVEELFQYLDRHPQIAEQLLKELAEAFEEKMIETTPLNEAISKRMLNGLLAKMNEPPVVELTPSNKRNWKPWFAAAMILLLAGSAVFFIAGPRHKTIAAKTVVNPQHIEKDVLPGFDGAVLTTADGSQIILDSASNGIVNKEANADIIKQDNQLLYKEGSSPVSGAEIVNTLSTMKGRKFQLILADGSKVWLDAASSITYPITFNGTQRKVRATGQVYFEVAKDPAKPFIVEVGEASVQVLGTHFNVNAYSDEGMMKTTLLEGSVKITSNRNSSLLRPGQQAAINNETPGSIKVHNEVDLDAVMAWKNGLFQFNGAGLTTVLRQLSRWYDVDIVYEGKIPEREFEGKIGRDLNLSQVLKILEKLQIHFRIEGNKVIVQP